MNLAAFCLREAVAAPTDPFVRAFADLTPASWWPEFASGPLPPQLIDPKQDGGGAAAPMDPIDNVVETAQPANLMHQVAGQRGGSAK